MKAPKVVMLILFCFAAAILNFPLWAQETKSMQKFCCPYCDMANFTTSKFCGACGSKLPARSLTANLHTGDGSTLKRFDDERDFRPQTAAGALVGGRPVGGRQRIFCRRVHRR